MSDDWDEGASASTSTGGAFTSQASSSGSSWKDGGGFGGGGGGFGGGDDRGGRGGRGRGGRGRGGFRSEGADENGNDGGSSWKSGGGGGGGGSSSWNSGGGGGGSSGGGSSWNSEGGEGGFRGRGRGGSRGGRSDGDDGGSREGFGGGRGGRGRGGFRQGGAEDGNEGSGGGYRGKDEEVFSKGPRADGGEDGGEERPRVTYIPAELPDDEASIFSHYESGINFDKYDQIMVDVSGNNPPKAIMTFEEAQFCESLKRNVSKSGYVKPTPVQKHGIPIITAGRDLMACAQTGSGKTAAFLLPILQQLMADGVAASQFSELQEPEVVIVAPTRELINQIYMEARKFAHGTCVRPVVVYGGIATGHQIRDICRGCNVLCGTPGRLLDMIQRGKVGLSKVRYLVLDEADRMLDMGFEPDMRKLVGSPGLPPKEERQTLMFSATFPEDIQRLAADFLKTDYLFLAVGVVGGACSDVEQKLIEVTKFSKRDQLLDVLKTTGTERTMVFVETKRQADFIATFLCQEKVATTSIHGDREQREREQALHDFRTGKCPVLVATSVAARGLDIPDVQHVVNFDLPKAIDEYVHRIGRTGRCGNTGKAISFYDRENDNQMARSLVKILSSAQQEVPAWLEDSAMGATGSAGFNPGRTFASTDSRKGGAFNTDSQPQAAAAQNGGGDDDWE